MPLRAIIFDVDGTLAETEEAHRRAFNLAFAEAGLLWRWTARDYAALLTTTGGRERIARYRREVGLPPDPEVVAALHVRKNQLYAELVARRAIVPRPGVVRLIEEARARGIALAIATTTSRSNLAALLDDGFAGDARDWFSTIVVGEDVSAKKPDPEVYERVLALLSLAPRDCVAIEDSSAGLAAAAACGIATIVTPSTYTRSQTFIGAALVAPDLDTGSPAIDVDRLETLLMCGRPPVGPWRILRRMAVQADK